MLSNFTSCKKLLLNNNKFWWTNNMKNISYKVFDCITLLNLHEYFFRLLKANWNSSVSKKTNECQATILRLLE